MVDRDVSQSMVPRVSQFFADNFAGRSYPVDSRRQLRLTGLRDLRVFLPWARTFECVIEFGLDYVEEGR